MLTFFDFNVRMDKTTGDTEILMGDGWRPFTKEGWQMATAPKPSFMKRYSLHITVVLCFVIWAATNVIHSLADTGVRFEKMGENSFVMFDRKTAQACWSGPQQPSKESTLKSFLDNVAENGMPYCRSIR